MVNANTVIRVIINVFFFNDTATTEIYTLSLHDALPISRPQAAGSGVMTPTKKKPEKSDVIRTTILLPHALWARSEEHTSELQSHLNLVCRLLLEKKNSVNMKPPRNPSRASAWTSASAHP